MNIIHYSEEEHNIQRNHIVLNSPIKFVTGQITIGLIGTGGFAVNVLLPIIQEYSSKFRLKTVVNRTGEKAINVAKQFHAEKVSTDASDIFDDEEIDLVVIVTRNMIVMLH